MATRGSSAWRDLVWGPACITHDLVAVAIYPGGPKFQCHRLAKDAFIQLGLVFLRHHYIVRRAGGFNCRRITGGTSSSSHSWGISVDINDDTNPYRLDKLVTDMTPEMIADVTAIVTANGIQVFRWGGDWDGRPETRNSNYDSMHFEIIATPEELAHGFELGTPAIIGASYGAADAATFPTIRRGDRGAVVMFLQELLGMENTTGVGTFGPRTEESVRRYQRLRGLSVDGVVGAATWTSLFTQQPHVSENDGISPQKLFA